MENTPPPQPAPGPVVVSPNMRPERIWIDPKTGKVVPPPKKPGR